MPCAPCESLVARCDRDHNFQRDVSSAAFSLAAQRLSAHVRGVPQWIAML
jgi:hypothetical protein